MLRTRINGLLLIVFSKNEQNQKTAIDKEGERCYHVGCRDNEKRDTENVPVSPCVDESI